MPDLEGKKTELEQEPSPISKEAASLSKVVPELATKVELPEETEKSIAAAPAQATLLGETSPVPAPFQKVELKKHGIAVPSPLNQAVGPDSEARASMVATAVPVSLAVPPATHPKREIAANLPEAGLEMEVSFVLGRKRLALAALSTLEEGEIIALSETDFKVTLFLQEKAIAEAQLITVDQHPSVQITKVFSGA